MLRRSLSVFLVLTSLVFLSLSSSPVWAVRYANKIIVNFKPNVIKLPAKVAAAGVKAADIRASSVVKLNTKHRVYRVEQLYAKILELRPDWTDLADYYVLVFPSEEASGQAAADFKKDPNVKNAIPVGYVQAFSTTPNDPRFSSQYGFPQVGVPQAWDKTTGSNETLVAVLDTGVNYNHEDLTGRVDVADGYDFVNDDPDPMDDHSILHGTGSAGIIAATANNSKGIAGMDWKARILPIKVLAWDGYGTMDNILRGLAWARLKGANIVNMSFGQYVPDANLEAACQQAYNEGIVLVASAGNNDTSSPSYPAAYTTVLAVGAIDQAGQRSIWGNDPWGNSQASNYGSWVDVCAAGTSVETTYSGTSGYRAQSGTSFSSPLVAGLASLIKSAYPALTSQQTIDLITSEADVITTDKPIGKRVNAFQAVAGITAIITSPSNEGDVHGLVSISGSARGWGFNNYIVRVLQSGTFVATLENSTSSVEGNVLASWQTAGLNGSYTIKLTVFNVEGSTREAQVNVNVDNTTPEAKISSPANGAAVVGKITVTGTAEDQRFDNYILEYGEGASPAIYQQICQVWSPVSYNDLGSWETSGLNGNYTLRLRVFDKAGNVGSDSVLLSLTNSVPVNKDVLPQTGLPLTYLLPNPLDFSRVSEAYFRYVLSAHFNVKIYLFDLSGNLIWKRDYLAGNDGAKAGLNTPAWDGRDMAGQRVTNGVYVYQIVVDQKPLARGKIIVIN